MPAATGLGEMAARQSTLLRNKDVQRRTSMFDNNVLTQAALSGFARRYGVYFVGSINHDKIIERSPESLCDAKS
jgi:hypothetical protein